VSLFELADFAPATPTWAEACIYCTPGEDGYYDEAGHLRRHLPLACAICGQREPNRLLFEMNHVITLGGSWERNALVCQSLHFKLNHLLYAALKGHEPQERDMTALELGWRVDKEGAYPPEGWPDGSHAVKCEAVAA
jgi:hypothetical protein